ncbi:unnamed protein product [Cochlearia groenlandica]
MAGQMKLACLFLACMIVAGPITSTAALTCGQVNKNMAACIGYLTQRGPLPRACCTGVANLVSLARTTPDRQQTCRCLKGVVNALGPRLNFGHAASIPKECGVIVPFPINTINNCNNVK